MGDERADRAERHAVAAHGHDRGVRDLGGDRAGHATVVERGVGLERAGRRQPAGGDVAQRHGVIAEHDRAGARDGEHAADPRLRQRDLGGAAREADVDRHSAMLRIAARPGGAGAVDAHVVAARAHAHAAGHDAHAGVVGNDLDVVGGDLADAGEVGGQAAGRDDDAADARGAAAAAGGRAAMAREAAGEAHDVGVAARVDVDREVRPGDADLVGAERAAQQRLERARRLDRLGGHEVAEAHVGQAPGAGAIGVHAADVRADAGRAAELGRERVGARAHPQRSADRRADRQDGGRSQDASFARSHQ